jgi:hypothetical protein
MSVHPCFCAESFSVCSSGCASDPQTRPLLCHVVTWLMAGEMGALCFALCVALHACSTHLTSVVAQLGTV